MVSRASLVLARSLVKLTRPKKRSFSSYQETTKHKRHSHWRPLPKMLHKHLLFNDCLFNNATTTLIRLFGCLSRHSSNLMLVMTGLPCLSWLPWFLSESNLTGNQSFDCKSTKMSSLLKKNKKNFLKKVRALSPFVHTILLLYICRKRHRCCCL